MPPKAAETLKHFLHRDATYLEKISDLSYCSVLVIWKFFILKEGSPTSSFGCEPINDVAYWEKEKEKERPYPGVSVHVWSKAWALGFSSPNSFISHVFIVRLAGGKIRQSPNSTDLKTSVFGPYPKSEGLTAGEKR